MGLIKKTKVVLVFKIVAAVGSMEVKFPLTSSPVRSMTQNYLTPMKKTFDMLGEPPFSIQQGVRKAVEWLEAL